MMPGEPTRDQQAAKPRGDGYHKARDDLDDPHDVHRIGRVAGNDVVERRREVTRPVVGQDPGELVDAEQDRVRVADHAVT